MKKIIFAYFVIMMLFGSIINAKPGIEVSFGFFYSSLRPYGSWIQLDGDVVAWHPRNIHRDWRPYSIGRWSWTNDGWYWDSDEPFGWATYHYGRWYLDDYYGWIWIPDYEWAPSWVEWRYNDDYIGWAPLPPYASFNIHRGIHFSIGWHSNHRWWNFISYGRFGHSHIHHYLLDDWRCSKIFGATKYRNNFYYDRDRIVNGGVDRSFIERRGGYRIGEREIRSIDNREEFERSRERDRDRIYTYRPSQDELTRNNREEKFDIRRGDRSATFERDKLSTPRFAERDANQIERNSSRNEERTRDSEIRNQRDIERQNSDREIQRSREENNQREAAREESIKRREENQQRENARREAVRQREAESQPIERRNEVQRGMESERRVERREERNNERPSFRNENNNSRSEGRSESRGERESRGSERRR